MSGWEVGFVSLPLFVIGGAAGYIIRRMITGRRIADAEKHAHRIRDDAVKEAEKTIKEAQLQAKDILLNARTAMEKEERERREEMLRREKRLQQKEDLLDRRLNSQEKKESDLRGREKGIVAMERAAADKEQNLK